ncbi:hypothetical protein T265_01661 [Opisthorchis viverrini]|uniref:Uncharacterized protein n=1 Tax=Opisthorchis viverrini TaxID=6198 RepID=A0A074ZXS2_OPIVI|nr:hypothetical protein T265_01661 [Opisthorchis viverrini]KER32228.1 hypothetical protein T265_01661 [Opisthorchis viverrini]
MFIGEENNMKINFSLEKTTHTVGENPSKTYGRFRPFLVLKGDSTEFRPSADWKASTNGVKHSVTFPMQRQWKLTEEQTCERKTEFRLQARRARENQLSRSSVGFHTDTALRLAVGRCYGQNTYPAEDWLVHQATKGHKWTWIECQRTFDPIKSMLSSDFLPIHCNPSLQKTTAHAVRALTSAQRNYSHIENESLAIVRESRCISLTTSSDGPLRLWDTTSRSTTSPPRVSDKPTHCRDSLIQASQNQRILVATIALEAEVNRVVSEAVRQATDQDPVLRQVIENRRNQWPRTCPRD